MTSKDASLEAVERLWTACLNLEKVQKFAGFQVDFTMSGNRMDAEEDDGYLNEQLAQSEAPGNRYGVGQ